MTYFYVDDGLNGNPKARALPLAALGLWVLSGSYSGQHLTEGIIPEWFVKSTPGGKAAAKQLVDGRMWHGQGDTCASDQCPANRASVPDGHFAFHDWYKVNRKTKDIVEAEREATRARVQRFRERERNSVSTHPQSNPIQTKEKQLTNPPTNSTAKDPTEDVDNSVENSRTDLAIMDAVMIHAGRQIDRFGAMYVLGMLNERRGKGAAPVKDVGAWARRAIKNDWSEVQKWIDEKGAA